MKHLVTVFCSFLLTTSLAFAAGDYGSDSSSSGESDSNTTDPFKVVYDLIKREKYNDAHKELAKIVGGAKEADRLNLLGFTVRKSGKLDVADKYYEAALTLHPGHVGAIEYQGELYIQLGDISKAKENLAKLEKICWIPCNAETNLRESIQTAEAK